MITQYPNGLQQILLTQTAERLLVVSHRRAGLTLGLIMESLEFLEKVPGAEIHFITPHQSQLTEVTRYFDNTVRSRPFTYLQLQASCDPPVPTRRFKNGSIIRFSSHANQEDLLDLSPSSPTHLIIDNALYFPEGAIEETFMHYESRNVGGHIVRVGTSLPTSSFEAPWFDRIPNSTSWESLTFPVTHARSDVHVSRFDSLRNQLSTRVWEAEYLCHRIRN